jgi:hypothetical protein
MKGLYDRFYKGNISELLADYLLSAIGVTTPVRRQFDRGIDFYCDLMDNESGYLTFGNPFTIQIKSASSPSVRYGPSTPKKWKPDALFQLFRNEVPFFVGIVDKKKTSISIYDTTGLWQLYLIGQSNFSEIKLITKSHDKMEWRDNVTQKQLEGWEGSAADGIQHIIDMGNPIIDIEYKDLENKDELLRKKGILRNIINIERANIVHRNLGVNCFREIKKNAKNDSFCEWGMNFRNDFRPEYITKIYDSIRLSLISLSANLQTQQRDRECEAAKNLLKFIPPADYYNQLLGASSEFFGWIYELSPTKRE